MTAPSLDDLLAYLNAAPSPWQAASISADRLVDRGFSPCPPTQPWMPLPERGVMVRGGAVVAWVLGEGAGPRSPIRLVGAHTDSPCLKVKPKPDGGHFGWRQLGVEVYGGVLLNSWLDRDLGLAGRVVLRDGTDRDIVADEAVCRVPQLAIHLDRDVNERGLVLDKQSHLAPVWGTGASRNGDFAEWLAARIGVRDVEIATWDLCLFDRTPAGRLGVDGALVAGGRLDNLVSCWAATEALATAQVAAGSVALICLFDHEEVGSESTTGAAGPMLTHVIDRMSVAQGGDAADRALQMASSFCVSADNAHAIHPNYPERHEPAHRPLVNHGPAIKLNSNQRYATTAAAAALMQRVFEQASVPWQTFVSRNNMPCGSTIGPITATRLGIDTVDVGVPQLSMHSARELCGADDPLHLHAGLRQLFAWPAS
jgi:aspartyl aminopeptidase